MNWEFSEDFARKMDQEDPLSFLRDRFFIPKVSNEEAVYFTGNSLGLQPKTTASFIQQELKDWAELGVEGHFHGKTPWFDYHKVLTNTNAKIVGALDSEVVVMNGLTTNLHLLWASFYKPTKSRFKIICEAKAFPSDQYVMESQAKFHGFNPDDAIVEVAPRDGEYTIRTEDILAKIEELGSEVALVFWGGVNYYTGQVFDMETITKSGHSVGAKVGFDLAHAAGNVKLQLHDWGVDFAAWCSYKYLNSGPGNVSGVFIHKRHGEDSSLPRFAGWWGHDEENRFLMEKGFVPSKGAEGWQLSNAPIFGMAAHRASLEIFEEVGMDQLIAKSRLLVAYLEYILTQVALKFDNCNFESITPTNPEEKGCQVSVLLHGQRKELFDKLTKKGVLADWREPNVIRMAPVPLYNSFEDIFRFGKKLEASLC
ncbi:kynureninase [Flavobacteriales bacterium]|jgi:kynureninase|nr:kynureninase [Flavobacteriales bacterium]